MCGGGGHGAVPYQSPISYVCNAATAIIATVVIFYRTSGLCCAARAACIVRGKGVYVSKTRNELSQQPGFGWALDIHVVLYVDRL